MEGARARRQARQPRRRRPAKVAATPAFLHARIAVEGEAPLARRCAAPRDGDAAGADVSPPARAVCTEEGHIYHANRAQYNGSAKRCSTNTKPVQRAGRVATPQRQLQAAARQTRVRQPAKCRYGSEGNRRRRESRQKSHKDSPDRKPASHKQKAHCTAKGRHVRLTGGHVTCRRQPTALLVSLKMMPLLIIFASPAANAFMSRYAISYCATRCLILPPFAAADGADI